MMISAPPITARWMQQQTTSSDLPYRLLMQPSTSLSAAEQEPKVEDGRRMEEFDLSSAEEEEEQLLLCIPPPVFSEEDLEQLLLQTTTSFSSFLPPPASLLSPSAVMTPTYTSSEVASSSINSPQPSSPLHFHCQQTTAVPAENICDLHRTYRVQEEKEEDLNLLSINELLLLLCDDEIEDQLEGCLAAHLPQHTPPAGGFAVERRTAADKRYHSLLPATLSTTSTSSAAGNQESASSSPTSSSHPTPTSAFPHWKVTSTPGIAPLGSLSSSSSSSSPLLSPPSLHRCDAGGGGEHEASTMPPPYRYYPHHSAPMYPHPAAGRNDLLAAATQEVVALERSARSWQAVETAEAISCSEYLQDVSESFDEVANHHHHHHGSDHPPVLPFSSFLLRSQDEGGGGGGGGSRCGLLLGRRGVVAAINVDEVQENCELLLRMASTPTSKPISPVLEASKRNSRYSCSTFRNGGRRNQRRLPLQDVPPPSAPSTLPVFFSSSSSSFSLGSVEPSPPPPPPPPPPYTYQEISAGNRRPRTTFEQQYPSLERTTIRPRRQRSILNDCRASDVDAAATLEGEVEVGSSAARLLFEERAAATPESGLRLNQSPDHWIALVNSSPAVAIPCSLAANQEEKEADEVHQEDDIDQRHVPCSKAGCQRYAQTKGLCKTHGGGIRCKEPGCFKVAQTGGRCRRHGGARPCRFAGCEVGAQRDGLCSSHGGIRRCSFAGCSKNDRGGGLCAEHGGGTRCRLEGCSGARRHSGLCGKHYQQRPSVSAALPAKEKANAFGHVSAPTPPTAHY